MHRHKYLELVAPFLFAAVLSGCGVDDDAEWMPVESLSELEGLWRSRGYGWVLDIRGDSFALDEISRVSCLRDVEAPIAVLDSLVPDPLVHRDGSRARLRIATTLKSFELERIEELPELCRDGGTPATRDPVGNFDVLWHTFDEHYPFFDEHGVDWQASYDVHRARVSDATTDEELFAIAAEMLAPLHDVHVSVADGTHAFRGRPDSRLFQALEAELEAGGEYPSLEAMLEDLRQRHLTRIEARYLGAKVESGANGMIRWGRLRDDLGYLNVLGTAGFAPNGSEDLAAEWAALDAALDAALATLADVDTLVVDVRLNLGGFDHAANRIAARFADRPRGTFTSFVRDDRGETDPQSVRVEPGGAIRFTRPVILLVSPIAFSAAETLALSMRVLPQVVVVGERTGGNFSDMMDRRLPNGWTFTLSNERYVAADGECYEGLGVPPDTEIRFWTDEDRAMDKDAMLDQILAEWSP